MTADLKGKNVLVVGLGKSGVASALFLEARGARVTVSDARGQQQLQDQIPALLDKGITVETGKHGERTFRDQDLIVVSPGVPSDLAQLARARREGTPVIGEIELAARFLQGEIVVEGNSEVFHASDGRELPLSILSSGTQELLPLITCLREFVALSCAVAKSLDFREALHRRLFFVEEPEANVFPSTQYDLVRAFARMANEPVLDASWVITTHSPYILTAFNTLIEAWRVGNKKGKHNEVAKIIGEKYWVSEDDFAAYAIRDGVLVPIFTKEDDGKEGSGLIDGNYLDSVSDQLGGEFDKLLDIEYAN